MDIDNLPIIENPTIWQAYQASRVFIQFPSEWKTHGRHKIPVPINRVLGHTAKEGDIFGIVEIDYNITSRAISAGKHTLGYV